MNSHNRIHPSDLITSFYFSPKTFRFSSKLIKMLFDLKAIIILSIATSTLANPGIEKRAAVRDVICDLGENWGNVLVTRAQLNAAMNGWSKYYGDSKKLFPPVRPNGFLEYRVNDPTRLQVRGQYTPSLSPSKQYLA